MELTFAEQVKVVLKRKGMTIKELAELIEKETGLKMSRQNLTQRLGRDNFQEQDMRMIAGILGCRFQLDILEDMGIAADGEKDGKPREKMNSKKEELPSTTERDITVGELIDINDELDAISEEKENNEKEVRDILNEVAEIEQERTVRKKHAGEERVPAWKAYLKRKGKKDVREGERPEDKFTRSPERSSLEVRTKKRESAARGSRSAEKTGDINPYTGQEYKSNSVRVHPKKIGYVQVYDREEHKWTDMTEWAFLGYQERKKVLLGKNYDPPTYLD